jgi:GT2 family glycosyltransferase
VPSPNLGGAGGFARGLIHLRNEGWATHVVFMDDDISLGPDAIVRTVALLRHAHSDDLCVHGAMLSEERRWMQFEAGSHYSFRSVYPLRAVGRLEDLRDRDAALRDAPEVPFDYTAWWFTVFPVHLATQNPLPVFVRGDDVAYGLMHTGEHTVTLNGVVVWHADFALKNNPSSLYYEVRNFALIDTLVFDDHKWWNLAWRFLSFGFRNLYSHRYASCEYSIAGMRQFLAGPEKWGEIDHAGLHDTLRQVSEEKAAPLPDDLASLPMNPVHSKPVRLVGFILALLLRGGRLLPGPLRSKKPGVVEIDVRAVGLALRHTEVLYRHPRIAEGFTCRRDAKRFARLEREVFAVSWRLFRDYRSLRARYRAAYPQMVSDEAWETLFSRGAA